MKRGHRILHNRRRTGILDAGDIDEVVIFDASCIHIEQMTDRCWWVGIYLGDEADSPYWMGNFVADSRGRMSFVEQENAGVEWTDDACHVEPRSESPSRKGTEDA